MKKIDFIISKLVAMPEYKKLVIQQEISYFKKKCILLEIQKQIDFVFIKGNTLFFAMKHPACCAEINKYKSREILDSIKSFPDIFPSLQDIETIKAYVPKHSFQKLEAQNTPIKVFHTRERSNGAFINNAKDPILYEIFERIRKYIIANKKREIDQYGL